MPVERDHHYAPVPEAAWAAEGETRRTKGRVEIFNAIKPVGMNHWTMDVAQHELVRNHILDRSDHDSSDDAAIRLQDVVEAAQRC